MSLKAKIRILLFKPVTFGFWNFVIFFNIGLLSNYCSFASQYFGMPLINTFDPEKYRAGSQCWAAVQDQRGVLYFGNSNGILEYDGHNWQLITVSTGNTVRSLSIADDGTIYYGAIGDFGFLEASTNGEVQAVSLKNKVPEGEQDFNDVWQVLTTSGGAYFFCRNKVFYFVAGRLNVLRARFAPSQACVLNGKIFFADIDRGICMLDKGQLTELKIFAGIYAGKRIALAPAGEQQLLVARASGDFFLIELSPFWDQTNQKYDFSRQVDRQVVNHFYSQLEDFIQKNSLYKLIAFDQQSFILSTVRGGIARFDRQGRILNLINMSNGLSDNTVTDLFVDKDKNLWVSTNSGICLVEFSIPHVYFNVRKEIQTVTTCAALHRDRLYVGSFQGLYILDQIADLKSSDYQAFRLIENSPTEIWQLMVVGSNLLAASGQGLFLIENQRAQKIDAPPAGQPAISLSRSPRWADLLFVGLLGGMDVYQLAGHGRQKRWKYFGRMKNVQDNIRSLCEDINGNLWAGTESRGLLRIRFNDDNPLVAEVDRFGKESGLPENTPLRALSWMDKIYVPSQYGLWKTVLTEKIVLNPEEIRFSPDWSAPDHIYPRPLAISSMIVDKLGNFFFHSEEGIFGAKLTAQSAFRLESQLFKGIRLPEAGLFIHPDNSLWILHKKIIRVDLNKKKDYRQSFTTLIRRVILKPRKIFFGGTFGFIKTYQGKRTVFLNQQPVDFQPVFPFRENSIAFEFSSTFFEKPGTTQYQYMLAGFERQWNDWSTEARAEYTNLTEGEYLFRVRARNLYGVIGQEASFRFRILPPWYRTWWAYVLWLISGVALVSGLVYLNTWKLRRKKAVLEALVAKRTQELREASLTDPLTGLRNRRFIQEILQNDALAFMGFKNYLLTAREKRKLELEQTVFGVFLLDIDFFKNVNDSYGHEAGDKVLQQFARILKNSVRIDDALIRVGGEEFLVVLKKSNLDYLHIFASKIMKAVAENEFEIGDQRVIRKTCSIGYTSFPLFTKKPDLLSLEQTIMVADLGTYYAKKSGRNRAIFLEAGDNLPIEEDIIQKAVTSLEYALHSGFLKIGKIIVNE